MSLDRIAQTYRDALALHGDSPAAVLWPKGRQEERFRALTRHAPGQGGFSVLDFGCGLAHLKDYLDRNFPAVSYTGADLVGDFLAVAAQKHPDAGFQQVGGTAELHGEFDCVFASGVFNLLYVPDPADHEAMVRRMLCDLFARTRVLLAVNFMTDAVDYRQPGAYHQNPAGLLAFAEDRLSRRLVLDQSYMPYEFTLTVWRDDRILRPENVYGSQ